MSLKGADELRERLLTLKECEEVKRIVKKHGAGLQQKIQRNAVFKGHYQGDKFIAPTGDTGRSVMLSIENGGFTARSGPTVEHGPYLEYGTRFMAAQPFVRPAYYNTIWDFYEDLEKLVK